MGARVDTADEGRPPLKIHGGQSLQAIEYAMPMASAQVKTAVLFAGMFGHGADAALLEYADSEQMQDAPKVSF